MRNHECLVDAILDRKYERLVEESGPAVNGTERTVLSTVKDVVTKALFPTEKLKDLSNSHTPSSPIKPDTATPNSASKTKKKLNGANGSQGMFNQRSTMQTKLPVKASRSLS
jgi:hypothetical protein